MDMSELFALRPDGGAAGGVGGKEAEVFSDGSSSGGSRRSSFSRRLETLLQDKGLFEEMLLTDRKLVKKTPENVLCDDRGLFEELLLPAVQEDWSRQTHEILQSIQSEKSDNVPPAAVPFASHLLARSLASLASFANNILPICSLARFARELRE